MSNIVQQLASQLKEAAQNLGQGCGFPKCEFISLGFHCSGCSRKLCNRHSYFKMDGTLPKPICPACIIADHEEEIFKEGK